MDKKRRKNTDITKQQQQDNLADAVSTNTGYWYNKQDVENEEDLVRYQYQHSFSNWEDCVHDLIIEMYDCGLVKTEELYTIAYGRKALTKDSFIFRTTGLFDDDEDIDDQPISLPPVSESAQRKIYEKWTGYVETLLQIVEIHTSEEDRGAIIDELMTYGRKDLSILLYSPE